MSAAPLLKPISMVDCRMTSLSTVFASKSYNCFLITPSKSTKPFQISHFSPSIPLLPSISIKRRLPLTPLVAQTSDWAQQEEGGVEGEELAWSEEEQPVEEAAVSDWDGEDTTEGGVVAEGEAEGFVGEESYPEPPEEAKLFVGNLPYDMDSEKLAVLFDQAGVVEVAEVIYNRETEQSRGFGFVTMSTVEEAEKAVEMFHRYDVSGRLLTVNKAAPKGTRPERTQDSEPSLRIYVGNLPWQVDDSRLEQVFSEHGKVADARVVYDRESGRSRGFGFVTMASKNEVDDAIAALDGQSVDGRALRVNVAEERPRRGSF